MQGLVFRFQGSAVMGLGVLWVLGLGFGVTGWVFRV